MEGPQKVPPIPAVDRYFIGSILLLIHVFSVSFNVCLLVAVRRFSRRHTFPTVYIYLMIVSDLLGNFFGGFQFCLPYFLSDERTQVYVRYFGPYIYIFNGYSILPSLFFMIPLMTLNRVVLTLKPEMFAWFSSRKLWIYNAFLGVSRLVAGRPGGKKRSENVISVVEEPDIGLGENQLFGPDRPFSIKALLRPASLGIN
ncbi:unnamed protein product [Caenorhabditis auriculariae]|uniref:Uncharacterized protein n=1 Tax=Caenorhabditis auriculariae TaxID=2777116 RepID=A0A8S1HV79_9PELO|nr:unnamed protein product [Caenorhabditis auriculariae]